MGGRGHTRHIYAYKTYIYAAPRFVIYNTEKKAGYKNQIQKGTTRYTLLLHQRVHTGGDDKG